MHRPEKPGVLIRTLAGLLGWMGCVSPAWPHGAGDSQRDRLEQVIAPDDVYELCLVLARDQQLRYAFSASRELVFNIHYHEDHEVSYPVPEHQTVSASATFAAQSEQEYCLMWTNQGNGEVMLSLEYESY